MLPEPIFLNIHMYGIMIAIGILFAYFVLFFPILFFTAVLYPLL